MGYDLLAGILFVLTLPLVLGGFVLFWIMTNHRRSALEEAWAAYAASRGLELVPADGEWPNRTNPAIGWTSGDARFRLAVRGREKHVATRLEIRPKAALVGTAVISPDGGASFRVHERPSGIAARLLDDDVRRALLAFRQGDEVVLTYRRGKIVLTWPGGETNDARLDEARRLGDALATAVDGAFRGAGRAA
jgi:hypothetical protein